MSRKKLAGLLGALLLNASSGLAQSQPAPPAADPNYQQVSIPVPRAVSLIADVAKVLFSRDEAGKDKIQALIDRRRARSAKGDQNLNLSIPKNKVTRTLGLVEGTAKEAD
ncbi:hypothetical protein [Hymenobacter terrenus]|uniref:hypothetical protein n=1 Tax=Hymenobacter terrenus TaxID=1629124 RepID=UPI000619FD48|nr:hypothetical protein [Hymenobacter terrenus]